MYSGIPFLFAPYGHSEYYTDHLSESQHYSYLLGLSKGIDQRGNCFRHQKCHCKSTNTNDKRYHARISYH